LRFELSVGRLELGGLHFESRQNSFERSQNCPELRRYCFVASHFKFELAQIVFESERN
jgi:hypothetical protein